MKASATALLVASIAAAAAPAIPGLQPYRAWAWGLLAAALAWRWMARRGEGTRKLAVPVLLPLLLAVSTFAAGEIGSGLGLLAAFAAMAGLRKAAP